MICKTTFKYKCYESDQNQCQPWSTVNRGAMFPLRQFFSANLQFVGARANTFWQYSIDKHSLRKFDKFVGI